jgi:hypothetical protein
MTDTPSREDIFSIWSPTHGPWSPWVKPVLFAQIPQFLLASPPLPQDLAALETLDMSWAPAAAEQTALVLDMPGALGVHLGTALAVARGYRPVPLYNACPGPPGSSHISSAGLPLAVVDVEPIMAAIVRHAPTLKGTQLPYTAPPAFLLDSDRRTGRGPLLPGRFDNRWIAFPTDFPSAVFLRDQGIGRVMVVQPPGRKRGPQPDLARTLRRWQAGGISIWIKTFPDPSPPTPTVLRGPSRVGELLDRVFALVRLRRSVLGGFGGMIPDASSAGG